MILYWRDGLEVLEHLFANPIFALSMETTPYELLDENQRPVIGEFMSGSFASSYHVRDFFVMRLLFFTEVYLPRKLCQRDTQSSE